MAALPKEIRSRVCIQKNEPNSVSTAVPFRHILLLLFWQRFPVTICGSQSLCEVLDSGRVGRFIGASRDLFAGSFGLSLESAPSQDGGSSFLVEPYLLKGSGFQNHKLYLSKWAWIPLLFPPASVLFPSLNHPPPNPCCRGSVAQVCLTVFEPKDCSMPDFPVLH